MRHLFCFFFLPLGLFSILGSSLAIASQSPSSRNQNLSSRVDASFYTTARRLVQQQINLLARTEMALVEPDPNPMRVIRGQLLMRTKAVDSFLHQQGVNPQTRCSQQENFSSGVSPSVKQIYCSLFAVNKELLKLTPLVDGLLSRRGEVAWVRDLPLVSGERQSHPVISIAPLKRPQLGSSALPFNVPVPNVDSGTTTGIGRYWKTPIVNYITPPAPAIAPPPEVLKILQSAQALLKPAKAGFNKGTKFTDPRQGALLQDRHAFVTDAREEKIYAQFLAQPNTGIFRVLPEQMLQKVNGFTNRLQAGVLERYPFPSLGKNQDNLIPELSLQVVDNQFVMKNHGADYSLMVNIGDIPLENIDSYLKQVNHSQKNFLLSYQPPQRFQKLQIDRRRFLSGKLQDNIPAEPIFAQLPAQLNQTYLLRSLQFKLPETIKTGQPISVSDRLYIDSLLEMQSSDVIVAFRPVSRRSDGSYTILWRVVKQLPAPQIQDLEDYLQLSQK